MPSTYSSRLRLELQADGENAGLWGQVTNRNLGTLLETAVAGLSIVALPDANYTLTTNNGLDDEARYAALRFTGTLTATRDVIVPAVSKFYRVDNVTNQSLNIKTSGGTARTVAAGKSVYLFVDGTNTVDVITDLGAVSLSSAAITNTLSVGGAATMIGSGNRFAVYGVSSVFSANPASAGSLDNVVIGGTTPLAGSFTTLSASGAATLNGTGNKLTVSGAGSTFAVSPASPGTSDNVVIGGTTPLAGSFTTLSASGAATLNGTGNKLTVSGAGSTFAVSPASPGTSDNVVIGGTTPLAGTFSSLLSTGLLKAVYQQETKVVMGANDINLSTANYFTKTISGTTTLTVSNVPPTGTVAAFILELTNGGSATITYFAGVKWAGGIAPTLTTAGVDILGFYTHDGGTTWRGLVLAKDSK